MPSFKYLISINNRWDPSLHVASFRYPTVFNDVLRKSSSSYQSTESCHHGNPRKYDQQMIPGLIRVQSFVSSNTVKHSWQTSLVNMFPNSAVYSGIYICSPKANGEAMMKDADIKHISVSYPFLFLIIMKWCPSRLQQKGSSSKLSMGVASLPKWPVCTVCFMITWNMRPKTQSWLSGSAKTRKCDAEWGPQPNCVFHRASVCNKC